MIYWNEHLRSKWITGRFLLQNDFATLHDAFTVLFQVYHVAMHRMDRLHNAIMNSWYFYYSTKTIRGNTAHWDRTEIEPIDNSGNFTRSILIMKSQENNGTGEINVVTPTHGLDVYLIPLVDRVSEIFGSLVQLREHLSNQYHYLDKFQGKLGHCGVLMSGRFHSSWWCMHGERL